MSARLTAALVGAALVTVGAVHLTAAPAHAETVGTGPDGQRLTVSRTTGIPLAGTTVTVDGSGYDTTRGIYVAYCVDNGATAAPSPCGGGVDTGGTSGASHWISSDPPSYGEGLAVPYGPDGSFTVRVRVTARIGDVDCTVRRCVVATRNDHTRGADRSQDVRVPVTFAAAADPTTATPATRPPGTRGPAPTTAGTGTRTATPPAGTGPTTGAGGTATATAPTAAGTGAEPVLTTRVSDSGGTGRWFTGVLAGLAALLVVLVVRHSRRRSRR